MFKTKKLYREHKVDDFLRLRIRRWKDSKFGGVELYREYKKWCIENNTLPARKIGLYNALENQGFKKIKDERGLFYFRGVKLK